MISKLTEHQFQTLVINYLKTINVLAFEADVMSGLMFSRNNMAFINHHKKMGYVKGQPDLVVCLLNKVLFLELKTEKGKQSSEQECFQEKCEKLNIPYYVVRNLDELKAAIQQHI